VAEDETKRLIIGVPIQRLNYQKVVRFAQWVERAVENVTCFFFPGKFNKTFGIGDPSF